MCDTNTKEKTNGTKLWRLLLDGGTQVLNDLFDSISSPNTLPSVLKKHEADLRRKCFPDQIELLFPSDGRQPDSKTFDITLLSSLLQNCCGLKAPTTGWNKEPLDTDKSPEANIVRIKLFRNKLQHRPNSGISDSEFEELWNEIAEPLKDLGLKDGEINKLKSSPIDDDSEIHERFQRSLDHEERIETLEEEVRELKDTKKRREETICGSSNQLKSCVPEEPLNFIGRAEALKQIVDAKTVAKNPFVLVHGMAGIGKSTLIKKSSWDLHEKHGKIVYFVDLCQCKASEKEISKAITYKLYGGKKVENEPRESLNNWARNLEESVILVLDNAEDVLIQEPENEHGESGMPFEKILVETREFSNQKLSYLIASREVFNLDNLPKKVISLKPFEERDSLEFISLYLKENMELHNIGLTDEHKQDIVRLCSNIPLALAIVMPLLEDYRPDELIASLQSKPMEDILEPLKRAVSLSFEKIDNTLREWLVQLTVFTGPFTADSAMAVTGQSKKTDTVKNLKKLSRKSLLQNDKSKYSFHPFIHEFVDYGKNKAELEEYVKKGKSNFLKHFLSLILKNTELFWTKDRCKESLRCFFEERVHFEKALEMSHNGSLTGLAVWNTAESVNKLTEVVMYLECCISWDLLGKLLDYFISLVSNNGRKLELLCWKGHITRRKGNEEEYKKLLDQADNIYTSSQNETSELEVDDRSFVCYKIAKGRYLGYKGEKEKGVKTFEEIVTFCEKKIDVDPSLNEDYARANIELGHNLKHQEKYQQALEKYQQAIEIYENHLGKHIRTALSFKDIADGYLIQETQDNYEAALEYYKKALKMLEDLNCDSETHMILLLKNTGICYRKLKRYEESERNLRRASNIADKNLKEEHKYKCWVKQELAYLYEDMEDMAKAKTLAKQAMEMASKINLKSDDWPKEKEKLQKILEYLN